MPRDFGKLPLARRADKASVTASLVHAEPKLERLSFGLTKWQDSAVNLPDGWGTTVTDKIQGSLQIQSLLCSTADSWWSIPPVLQSLHIFHLNWPEKYLKVTDMHMYFTWDMTGPARLMKNLPAATDDVASMVIPQPCLWLPGYLTELWASLTQTTGMLDLRGLRHLTQLHKGKIVPKDTHK